jgi:hypothetical protein
MSALPAPSCHHCATLMRWYRAALVSAERRVLVHFYACTQCDRIATLETVDGIAQEPQVSGFSKDAETALWLTTKCIAAE